MVRLRGKQEGIGEDVVYDVLDHIAHRDAGPVHDLTGRTLGEFCELIGELDLFAGAPPGASLAALPSLGLRERGARPGAAPERHPAARGARARPEAARLRLLDPALASSDESRARAPSRSASGSRSTRRCIQLDPENDWDAELIAELKELASVDVLDLKGHYRARPSTSRPIPELYRRSPRRSPRPTSRTPT